MRPRPSAVIRRFLAVSLVFAVAFGVLLASGEARAATGTFKLKSTEVQEVGGSWHIYASIELPKPPLTAHQSMKFIFTKTAVYERSLIDGKSEPVMNRQSLQNQSASIEGLDVNFGDATGKIFKTTRFDFGLTRTRGYEAGEYKVELKTSDGVVIGTTQNLTLKGDNPVVDRRSIAFNAKDPSVKKVEGYDGGAKVAQNDTPAAENTMGEVTPTGTAKPFIPPEGHQPTEEEQIKTRPKGCGCSLPGAASAGSLLAAPLLGLAVGLAGRRRRRGR
jgi:MYXO-CTERM domain-containing protein